MNKQVKRIDNRNKIFFGVDPTVRNHELVAYFMRFGQVIKHEIKKTTNEKKCGFITFDKVAEADALMRSMQRTFKNKPLFLRRAVSNKVDALLNIDDKKVFIKGFAQNVTIDDLQGHFKSYGRIISTIIEEVEGVRRGSIEFNDYSSIDLLILDEKEHKIKGKIVELQFSLLGSANIPLATSRPSEPPRPPVVPANLHASFNISFAGLSATNSHQTSTPVRATDHQSTQNNMVNRLNAPGPMRTKQQLKKTTSAPYLLRSRDTNKTGCSSQAAQASNVVNLSISDCTCSICLDVLVEPVKLPCKHEYCLSCFKSLNMIAYPHCPYCRSKVDATWITSRMNGNNLVDKERWQEIQKEFSQQIKDKISGKTSRDIEEEICKVKHLIAKPGEIYQEYLSTLRKEQERKAEEERKSLDLINRILRDQGSQPQLINNTPVSTQNIPRLVIDPLAIERIRVDLTISNEIIIS